MSERKFPSPYDITPPAGAEGWRDLYPYWMVFREDRKAANESRFWFCDSQHWPAVFKPFEVIMIEFAIKSLGQYNTRQWLIPPANGIDYLILNGYIYMSPVAVPPEQIGDRVPHFLERAGFYFQNWPTLIENWHKKVKANIDEMEAIKFEVLPDVIDKQSVFDGAGLGPTHTLYSNYDKLIQLCYKAWQYHFEFLNLGYAAYLDFFGFCKQTFPGIPDQAIAKMVQGVEVDLFKPDDELKRLAKLAVKLGVADVLKAGTAADALGAVNAAPNGAQWLAEWEKAKHPWFNYSAGNGFYSSDKVWMDNLDIPFGFMRNYIGRVESGAEIDRPTAAIAAERDRITAEYASLLPDDDAKAAFEGKLGLSRVVFPYVENHNFYIEHWSLSVFWRKMRELSRVFMNAGFWQNEDDIFYLRREEITPTLFDYGNGWAVGVESIGPTHWPKELDRRKAIISALATRRPQPALNAPPEVITEPFTIMLWGITSESVDRWLNAGSDSGKLSGMAASPGTVEGFARIITDADQLDQLQDGEIMVAPITAPSWAPVFDKIAAAVTDIGGMMSHAAIVCREYGLPAVTGTGNASQTIKTGQRIRVNGSTGEVVVLN
jgi:pyruvate, water dikinase